MAKFVVDNEGKAKCPVEVVIGFEYTEDVEALYNVIAEIMEKSDIFAGDITHVSVYQDGPTPTDFVH
jgi:hypothetical protein